VRLGADVERITVQGGRATGVRLKTGEEIRAARSVIASVAPGHLYGSLLGDDAPEPMREAARNFRHGRGNFQLHYALDAPPRWIAEGLSKVALVHLTDGIDAVSKSHNEATRSLLPETPTLCVGQPASLDPSRCPPGKAILWVQVPDAPRSPVGDAAGVISANGGWDGNVARGFCRPHRGDPRPSHPRIRADCARPPRLFARRPRSDQCQPCRRRSLWRGLHHRPVFRVAATCRRRKSPNARSEGLYHIGASTHPGPGLSGGSGFLAAKELA
jgi:phytoene dehydrogenase-like protein